MTPEAVPGWYPDPRGGDGQRYWTGEAWAPDQSQTPGQPVDWAAQGSYAATYLSSHDTGFDPGYAGQNPSPSQNPYAAQFAYPVDPHPVEPPRSSWRRGATWVALSAGIIAGFAAGFTVADARKDPVRPAAAVSSPRALPSASPSPTQEPFLESDEPPTPSAAPPPSGPVDPEASVLVRLGLRPSDVDPSGAVALIRDGDGLQAATLDLCGGTFPSDARRTARRQLAAADSAGDIVMSSEAVLYDSASALEGGFAELTRAAPKCKADSTLDKAWPQVDGVQRLTFDFTTTGPDGKDARSTAVYLRSGRTLLALYFRYPGVTKTPVAGKKTISEVVAVFARRLAALPTAAAAT